MEPAEIVRQIVSTTNEVFTAMLGLEIQLDAVPEGEQVPQQSDGILSFVGFAGEWVGTGSVSCSAAMACTIADRLLLTPHPAVDEEVLDAVAEVTNMIIGNLKTSLEEVLGSMCLSIPTVIFGRNFTTRTSGRGEWTVVPFRCEGEILEVQVCLARNTERRGAGQATIHLPHVAT